ncbi:MAG TPA: HEAT repeat domain-containing protein [Micromonosporaceae bacterium]|nr:HEAT repeat domain-containing protein [Micromonosporaceae bacterium]
MSSAGWAAGDPRFALVVIGRRVPDVISAVTYAALLLLAGVGSLGVAVVLVRGVRLMRARRQVRLAAVPRMALLRFAAESGAEGADELVTMAPAAWRSIERTAVNLLGKIRGDAHQALVTVFERRGAADDALRALHSRSGVRRARAAEALGNLGRRDAVAALCVLLRDPRSEVRVVAVRALGRIGDPAAAEPLLASLADIDPAPSLVVAHALIQLDPAAEPALIRALQHPAPLVRVTVLDALGLLGAAASAVPVAEVARADPSTEVRVAAVATLGRLGGRAALAPLAEAVLAHEPEPLRAAAARALGDLGNAAAVASLGLLLDDPRYRVAHEAARALRRLGPTGLAELRRVAHEPPGTGTGPPTAVDSDPSPPSWSSAAAHAREALAMAVVGRGEPDPEPEAVQPLALTR